MSDIRSRILAQFKKDTAAHRLTILHDDGVYRHIRCADPGTFCGSFNIVTWPGHLSYSGDMGNYVFQRVNDMFTFFRGHHHPDLGYWAEKVQAEDKSDGIREYSEAAAREWVKERLDEGEAPETVRSEAAELDFGNGEVRLYDGISAINWRGFQDHWEANWKEYTHRFVWCCYALPFAIDLYDQAKKGSSAWSTEPPTRQGWYWHWNGDQDCAPLPTSVLYSGTSGKCFVSRGQLCLDQAIDCDQLRQQVECLRAELTLAAKPVFDLVTHLHRQRAFSERTFGPGQRTAGVLDHLRKELREIEANPADISEWIDVVLLALDGAWRHGFTPEQIAQALAAKQAKNEARQWPDWRTAPDGQAIEHKRDGAEGGGE